MWRNALISADAFQFHFGAIKSTGVKTTNIHKIGFNSTLVRLKAISPVFNQKFSFTFQFHFGTIKRPTPRS